jgi:hypothetical protein
MNNIMQDFPATPVEIVANARQIAVGLHATWAAFKKSECRAGPLARPVRLD